MSETKTNATKFNFDLLNKCFNELSAAHKNCEGLAGTERYLELSKVYGVLMALVLEGTALMADCQQEMKQTTVGNIDVLGLENLTELFKKKAVPGSN